MFRWIIFQAHWLGLINSKVIWVWWVNPSAAAPVATPSRSRADVLVATVLDYTCLADAEVDLVDLVDLVVYFVLSFL